MAQKTNTKIGLNLTISSNTAEKLMAEKFIEVKNDEINFRIDIVDPKVEVESGESSSSGVRSGSNSAELLEKLS